MIFERDIPALAGKTWQERVDLRKLARVRDKRINVRTAIIAVSGGVLGPVVMALRHDGILPAPTLLWIGLGLLVVMPSAFFAHAWWINPLVKEALRSPRQPSEADHISPAFDY